MAVKNRGDTMEAHPRSENCAWFLQEKIGKYTSDRTNVHLASWQPDDFIYFFSVYVFFVYTYVCHIYNTWTYDIYDIISCTLWN